MHVKCFHINMFHVWKFQSGANMQTYLNMFKSSQNLWIFLEIYVFRTYFDYVIIVGMWPIFTKFLFSFETIVSCISVIILQCKGLIHFWKIDGAKYRYQTNLDLFSFFFFYFFFLNKNLMFVFIATTIKPKIYIIYHISTLASFFFCIKQQLRFSTQSECKER